MQQDFSKYLGIAGLLLLGAAATLFGVHNVNDTLTTRLFVVGAIAVVVFLVMNYREVLSFARGRSARRGASAIISIVIFTTILVIVQAISIRNSVQVDLTRNQRFTLADQTRSLLAELNTDVKIHAFFRGNSSQRARATELLTLYERASTHVTFEFVDPDRRPQLADQLGAGYQDVVVSSAERSRIVERLNEENLTNALLNVVRDRFRVIYFTTGHSEKSISNTDRGGYSKLHKGLESQGYIVRELGLVDVDRVPADCEVLIIGGPRKQFLASETDLIQEYLDQGGSAMILIDPRLELPGIEGILATYNIILDPVILLDELVVVDSGDRVFDETVTKIRRYEDHPITRGFNVITMFPIARPVRILEDENNLRLSGSYLAITGESAWGEVDIATYESGSATRDGDDIAPPLPVAAVVTKSPPIPAQRQPGDPTSDSRVVIFGDSDFVNNAFYGLLGNSDLFLNSVSYLAQEENLISIRPKDALGDSIFITAAQGRFIFAISIILLPLTVVATGLSVVLRRKDRA